MKKILAGSAVIMALGITNADANAYKIVDKKDGSELCKFTTAIGKTSYGDQIIDHYGRVTKFSCGNWPYGSGPGVIFYGEGGGWTEPHNSPSALVSNVDGVPPYYNENVWRIGNFFYGEELKYDFITSTWTQFDTHQNIVNSGEFRVEQVAHQGVDQETVACKLYDSEGMEVGSGVYTYTPSITETIYHNGDIGTGGTYDTSFATKANVYAILKDDGETGEDYMFTHTFEDIWAGDNPAGLNSMHEAGFETIEPGWHKHPPYKVCGQCEITTFSMNFDTPLKGTWNGFRYFNNSNPPYRDSKSNDGAFTCSIQSRH
jgi:hypothetical protein